MIDSITAKNFQSWKDLFLKLDPGVNAIIGPSDSGKTAIFRLLNWITNNRPGGDEFRSWWGGDTVGGIDLKEGYFVQRIKKDSDNLYTLTDPDGDEDEYRGFGQTVPENIKAILNLSEINFRFQFDGQFLLGQSPGANAKYLNNIINLDIIDTCLYNINSRWREENRKLETQKGNKKELEQTLKGYDWIDGAEKLIEKVEKVNNKFRELKKDYNFAYSLLNNLEEIEEKLSEIDLIIQYEGKINSLIELDGQIESLIDDEEELQGLEDELRNTTSEIQRTNNIVKHENKIAWGIELGKLIQSKREIKIDLNFLFDDLMTTELNLAKMERKLKEAKKEFHRLMPDQCPLCGK
jgi:chromosome segregation ATPase